MFLNAKVLILLWFLFSFVACKPQGNIDLPYESIFQIIIDHIPKKTSSVLINNENENFELYPFNLRVFKENGYQIDDFTHKPIVLDSLISNFQKFNIQTFEVANVPYGKDSLKENNQVYIECSDFFHDRKSGKGVFFIRFLCGRLCGGECYFLFKGQESNMEMVESFCTIP